MASSSETGHAINVANLEDLISFAVGYGAKYSPSKASIKIPALQTLAANAQTALANVITTENAFEKATNARRDAFKPLKALSTRIINALDATDATANTIADAKAYNKKIQGDKKKAKSPEATPETATASETETPKQISTSQQSYDRLIDHFSKWIDLLKNEPAYVPNETELKVATLQALLTTLKTTNTAVINAYSPYSNALAARNALLYTSTTGLVDTAQDVKKYVKSVFGATSPQYKQVAAIKFTKRK